MSRWALQLSHNLVEQMCPINVGVTASTFSMGSSKPGLRLLCRIHWYYISFNFDFTNLYYFLSQTEINRPKNCVKVGLWFGQRSLNVPNLQILTRSCNINMGNSLLRFHILCLYSLKYLKNINLTKRPLICFAGSSVDIFNYYQQFELIFVFVWHSPDIDLKINRYSITFTLLVQFIIFSIYPVPDR